MASSKSASRGRSRSRSHTPPAARRASSPAPDHSRSPRRSPSRSKSPPARERSRSASLSRSPDTREYRNGNGDRARSRTRSRSPSRDGRRSYRERSYSRSPSRGRRPQSSKIVVEKLTKNVTEAHLQEIFGSYGRIQSIDVPMNRQFMTNRGTAYIVYDSAAGSESAIAHMHEAQLDGAVITSATVSPIEIWRSTSRSSFGPTQKSATETRRLRRQTDGLGRSKKEWAGLQPITISTTTQGALILGFTVTFVYSTTTQTSTGSQSTSQAQKESQLQLIQQLQSKQEPYTKPHTL
ncbi:hypothetical protein PMZ80_007978 [Knufia obscura]|uniref:RRM domain-containing protein n=1 Tax=Knufia obscura TaxID=1635080 RepID=A0ABR0RG59_9EURO|nr:hypothetical protein PMZ80_007978 [Knufia obscura]